MLDKKLIDLLKPLKLKHFFKRFIHIITTFLMISAGISFAVMVVSRFIPITFIWNKLFIILGFSLILGILWSVYKKPSYRDTALLIDSFGLKERTTTALELKGEDTLVAELQKEDTIKLLEKKELKAKISLKPSMKILLFLFVFLIAAAAIGFIPTKSYVEAKEKEKNLEKLEEEKERIEKVKKDIEKEKGLSPEEKKKIEKALEELKKKIEESKSTKEAQKELVKAKKELKKIKKDIEQRKINEIAKKLGDKGFTKELAQKLKNRDSHEIAKEIEEMAKKVKNSNKEELEKLAKELTELQKLLKDNPELANAFKEIKDAAARSMDGSLNNDAVDQSLQSLSKAIGSQLDNPQVSKGLNEALNSLDELNNTLSQMSGEVSENMAGNQGECKNSGSNQPAGGGT